jgi:hypothetical protein
MKKIDIKKILKSIRVFTKKVISHSFVVVFILIAVAFLINNFLFNMFYFSPIKTEIAFLDTVISFDEDVHNEALYRWEKKEINFIEADENRYFDPFYPDFSMKRSGEKRLSVARTEELLSDPNIQALLKSSNLYEFYKTKGGELMLIEDRAEIWEELLLGNRDEYSGTYNQNILFLEELKKELTD